MTQNHRVGVTLGCFLRVVEKWDFEASEELKSQFYIKLVLQLFSITGAP